MFVNGKDTFIQTRNKIFAFIQSKLVQTLDVHSLHTHNDIVYGAMMLYENNYMDQDQLFKLYIKVIALMQQTFILTKYKV